MKTLVTWMSLVVLTVGVVFIACENAPEGTVAKVGKYTISADELEDNVARMKPRWKTVEEAFEGRMGALDNIIRQKLLLLGAYKEGLDKKARSHNFSRSRSSKGTEYSSKKIIILKGNYLQFTFFNRNNKRRQRRN